MYNLIKPLSGKRRNIVKPEAKIDQINVKKMKEHSWATKVNNFIFIPDSRIGWWPFAFFNILKNFKRNDFDLIFSTSPMFTSHLIAMAIKLIFKKPWVVDLRDLWVLNPYLRPPTRMHLKISTSIERKTFKLADRIITVGEELRQDLIGNYPEIPAEKFVVIPNGYDQADFKKDEEKKDKKFSISYTGSLYLFSGRTPYYFMTALGELLQKFPKLKKEIKVTFLGPLDSQNRKIFQNTIQEYDLKEVVSLKDPAPYRDAINCIKHSDLLLLILGKESRDLKHNNYFRYDRTSITGKLFEYLASGIPILALAGEGPVKKIIAETNSGYVVDPENIEEIKKMILFCYNLYKDGKLLTHQRKDLVRRFERKRLTGELARILDELTTKER